MEEKLIALLGRHTLENNMQIDEDISRLTRTLLYLSKQLIIIQRDMDTDDKLYVDDVIEQATKILN